MFTKAGFYTFVYGTRVGDAAAPLFLKFRSSNFLIITTIALAIFTDMFLYAMVVPVLPFALTSRAGVAEEDLQKWTSTFLSVYGAALAAGSPIFGWFADKSSSRRAPLLLGLVALAASTGLLCGGSSVALLLTGRLFQGLSASVVWTVGLALLSDTIPKESIGEAMGYVATATSIGALAGPLLGGVVYEKAGYYAVFGMGFAVIGLDVILRLSMIEKSVAKQWDPPQVPVTVADNTTEKNVQNPLELSSREEDLPTTDSTPTWSHRLPPIITLLTVPRILVSLLGCIIQSNSLAALDSALPLYVKNTFTWTSTGAGLIFICLVVPAVFSPLVGIVSDKFGSRAITTIGLLGAVPFWVCMRFVTYDTIGQKVLLCALLFGIGTSITFIMAPIMADLDHAVELEGKRRPQSFGKNGAAAQGFGLFNFAYAVGTMIGPLWAGFIIEKAGWGTMGWSLGLFSGVGAIAAFVWTGGRITLKGEKSSPSSVV